MAKILAFAGSNSCTSINHKLVAYTSSLLENHQVELLDMSKISFPMYSEDLEKSDGYSAELKTLMQKIENADALVISVNEHNSSVSAFFKNIIDWLSRMERKFLLDKKVLLMATSPGGRGGIGALETTESVLPRFGAEIIATFSLPSFHNNFDAEITDLELKTAHKEIVHKFLAKI